MNEREKWVKKGLKKEKKKHTKSFISFSPPRVFYFFFHFFFFFYNEFSLKISRMVIHNAIL